MTIEPDVTAADIYYLRDRLTNEVGAELSNTFFRKYEVLLPRNKYYNLITDMNRHVSSGLTLTPFTSDRVKILGVKIGAKDE